MERSVSVVITTYDRPRLLAEAVASALAATDPAAGDEVLVVDDCSPEPLDPAALGGARIVRRSTNGGSAAARNTGIDAAAGEWIAFLDDDDMYLPERLALVRPHLVDGIDVVVGHVRGDDGRRGPRYGHLRGRPGVRALEHLMPSMAAITARRSAAPRFDESLRCCEDVAWWIAVASHLEVAVIDDVVAVVRAHDGPRHRKGAADRAAARRALLLAHHDLLDGSRRARSFQWRRVAAYAHRAGDVGDERDALLRSLAARPSAGAAKALVRSLLP